MKYKSMVISKHSIQQVKNSMTKSKFINNDNFPNDIFVENIFFNDGRYNKLLYYDNKVFLFRDILLLILLDDFSCETSGKLFVLNQHYRFITQNNMVHNQKIGDFLDIKDIIDVIGKSEKNDTLQNVRYRFIKTSYEFVN